MNVWTVLEIDEDGINEPWVFSYTTEELAHKAIIDRHTEMWKESGMGPEADNSLQMGRTTNFEAVIFLESGDTWPRWCVTKTELK